MVESCAIQQPEITLESLRMDTGVKLSNGTL